MTDLDLSKSPRYQSALRVRAMQIVPEMLDGDDGFELEVDGKTITGGPGDYVVQMPDGSIEAWKREQFEREFEIEKKTKRLSLASGVPA